MITFIELTLEVINITKTLKSKFIFSTELNHFLDRLTNLYLKDIFKIIVLLKYNPEINLTLLFIDSPHCCIIIDHNPIL